MPLKSGAKLVDLEHASEVVPLRPDLILEKLKARNVELYRFGRKYLVKENDLLRLLREAPI